MSTFHWRNSFNASTRLQSDGARDMGFALIELLVALTVLALALLIVPSTMRLSTRAALTAADILRQQDEAAALAFVVRAIAGSVPAYENDQDGAPGIIFQGESNRLALVTALAGGPRGSGLYRVEFQNVADNATGKMGFHVSLAPRTYTSTIDGQSTVEPDRLRHLGFISGWRYYGVPVGKNDAEWMQEWSARDRLPDLVELTLSHSHPGANTKVIRIEPQLRVRR